MNFILRTSLWIQRESLPVTMWTVISLTLPGGLFCIWRKAKEHETLEDKMLSYFSYVEDFASSNDYFIQEFGNVYAKVLSHGYDSLEVVF